MKKFLFSLLLIIVLCFGICAQGLSPTPGGLKGYAAGGGITFDAVSSSAAGSGITKTVSHTTGSLTNGYMVVAAMNFNSNAVTVTYDTTQTLTEIGNDTGTSFHLQLYGIKAPHSGTHDVVVTWGGSNDCAVGVMTFDGVNQTTSVGTSAFASTTSTAPSVDVTSAIGELVVGAVGNNFNTTMTAGTGVTDKWNQGASAGFATAAGGYQSGATTTTFAWTLGSSKLWSILAIPLKPV